MMILFLYSIIILVPLVFPKVQLCIPKRNIFLLNFIFSERRFQIIPLRWNMMVQKIKLLISVRSLYLKCNLRVSGISWGFSLCNYCSLIILRMVGFHGTSFISVIIFLAHLQYIFLIGYSLHRFMSF